MANSRNAHEKADLISLAARNVQHTPAGSDAVRKHIPMTQKETPPVLAICTCRTSPTRGNPNRSVPQRARHNERKVARAPDGNVVPHLRSAPSHHRPSSPASQTSVRSTVATGARGGIPRRQRCSPKLRPRSSYILMPEAALEQSTAAKGNQQQRFLLPGCRCTSVIHHHPVFAHGRTCFGRTTRGSEARTASSGRLPRLIPRCSLYE